MTEKTHLVHANIHTVFPNPLNPRRNDGIKHEDMAALIKSRGWEIPITAYKEPNSVNYIVLSGHRRLFAAKKAGMQTVPLYVVPAPKDEQEELLRIGSLQRGQVDWSPYEWARYVHDRYVAWKRPKNTRKFAKEQLNMKYSTVEAYISVMDYFKDDVSQSKLADGTWAFTNVEMILRFINNLKREKPEFVREMGEKMIVRALIQKMERGILNAQDLRKGKTVAEKATAEQLRTFLSEQNMKMGALVDIIGLFDADGVATFQGSLISIGRVLSRINETPVNNKKEYDQFIAMLDKVISDASLRKQTLTSAEGLKQVI